MRDNPDDSEFRTGTMFFSQPSIPYILIDSVENGRTPHVSSS